MKKLLFDFINNGILFIEKYAEEQATDIEGEVIKSEYDCILRHELLELFNRAINRGADPDETEEIFLSLGYGSYI